MVTITDEAIQAFVDDIVRETGAETVYLFGSRARGQAHLHSDVDLLVVVPGPFGNGQTRYGNLRRLFRMALKAGVPADILLYTRGEVDHWRTEAGTVIGRAMQEGRVLHAAA
jgi:uncharacterized protein